MEQYTKEDLVDKIKLLINSDGTTTDINPDYLQYFELQELAEICTALEEQKELQKIQMGDYLDQLYEKCT